jgi:hypothetical protein
MTSPRSRGMAVLTVLATLAVGVALGIGVERRVLHRRPDNRGGRGGGGGGPFGMMSEPVDTATRNRMRGRIVKRLTDELSLTPTQAQSVDAIFARRELQLDSLRLRVNPQLDSLRDHMRLSIDSVLSPEQRVKFAEQRRRMDERRRTEAGHRGR